MLKPRNETLIAMFPPVDATYVVSQWIDAKGSAPLGADGIYYTSTIDLQGYSMSDMTFGTVSTQYQDPGIYSSNAASSRVETIDIISDIPISITDLNYIKDTLGVTVPGMLESRQDFTSILFGNYKLFVPNASLGAFPGFLQLISSGAFGSKEPSASATLYCYRILKCVGVPGETLQAPALRAGLFGTFYNESEQEYFMRLRRSYELQQLGV